MRICLNLLSVIVLLNSAQAKSAPRPLFQSGVETFSIVDSKSKPPTFRVLADSVAKQSVALAINSQSSKENSKESIKRYVELRFEKLTITPVKGKADRLALTIRVSGREYDLEQTIPKSDLLAGKTIEVKIPTQDTNVALFTVSSQGRFSLKYLANQEILSIERASGEVSFENPLVDEAPEKISFSAKGLRDAKR